MTSPSEQPGKSIERAFVLCAGGRIERPHLPPELTGQPTIIIPASAGDTIAAQTRATEAHAIRAALERCGFNRLAAAHALGLHKSTLFRKIKALGIELPDRDGRAGRKAI